MDWSFCFLDVLSLNVMSFVRLWGLSRSFVVMSPLRFCLYGPLLVLPRKVYFYWNATSAHMCI